MSGTVVAGSIDEKKMTCSVKTLLLDEVITDVLLNITDGNVKGVIPIPEDDTDVWLGWIDGEICVLRVGVVKKVIIDAPQILVTCEDVQINGGNNGGLPILQQVLDNLNQLKKYVEAMNTAVGSGLSAVGAGASANGATGKTAFETAMATQVINFKEMENSKVKH